MKKLIISCVVGLALLVPACSSDPVATAVKSVEKVSETTSKTVRVPVTAEGLTWQENLDKYEVQISPVYLNQICTYLKPMVSDGFFSTNEVSSLYEMVTLDIGDVNGTTDKFSALVISAVLKDCIEYRTIIAES